MKRVLLDVNVILDVLLDRKPHAEASAAAWAAVEIGAAKGLLAAHAVTTVYYLIRRESRDGVPDGPQKTPASVGEGEKLYGTECAACHGMNGRVPTDAGRWMYPRAADLTSLEVQSYTDRELFWIVRNGIRLSGMPAFGKVESDEHIWSLVHYVRSLNPSPGGNAGPPKK